MLLLHLDPLHFTHMKFSLWPQGPVGSHLSVLPQFSSHISITFPLFSAAITASLSLLCALYSCFSDISSRPCLPCSSSYASFHKLWLTLLTLYQSHFLIEVIASPPNLFRYFPPFMVFICFFQALIFVLINVCLASKIINYY